MNTTFSKYPTPKLGLGDAARAQGRDLIPNFITALSVETFPLHCDTSCLFRMSKGTCGNFSINTEGGQ